nr:MAG TPA: Protein of unknown function (DUF2833) [Caudoviricetes sp.]
MLSFLGREVVLIRKFEKRDLEQITVQEEQEAEAAKFAIPSTAETFETGGVAVAVFWYQEITPGRFALFSVINATAGRKMFSFVKAMRRLIEQRSRELSAERLEMTVLDGFGAGRRLAGLLGFEYEGTMRKVFNGKDYQLFARIFQ